MTDIEYAKQGARVLLTYAIGHRADRGTIRRLRKIADRIDALAALSRRWDVRLGQRAGFSIAIRLAIDELDREVVRHWWPRFFLD